MKRPDLGRPKQATGSAPSRHMLLLLLILALLWGCAANPETLREEKLASGVPEEGQYLPEEIDPQDWNRFYIAVFNEEESTIAEFFARGFEIKLWQEELAENLYFEIYHSIQGFESRYLNGPLDPAAQAYYDELEQSLIGLCQRLRDLGLQPSNKGDLIAAATFREFPALVKWLETEF